MRLSKSIQQALHWIFSGEYQQTRPSRKHKQTVHIHYEVHQHLHIQERDDLYHKVLNNVIQELPVPLALSPQPTVYQQTIPIKSYSVV